MPDAESTPRILDIIQTWSGIGGLIGGAILALLGFRRGPKSGDLVTNYDMLVHHQAIIKDIEDRLERMREAYDKQNRELDKRIRELEIELVRIENITKRRP